MSVIIAVDIDGILCEDTLGDYQEAMPRVEDINRYKELVEFARKNDWRIVIFTGRGSATGIDWHDFTIRQLKEWGIEYDDIIFGKPSYDFIIDDKAFPSIEAFLKVISKKLGR